MRAVALLQYTPPALRPGFHYVPGQPCCGSHGEIRNSDLVLTERVWEPYPYRARKRKPRRLIAVSATFFVGDRGGMRIGVAENATSVRSAKRAMLELICQQHPGAHTFTYCYMDLSADLLRRALAEMEGGGR